MAEKLRGYKSPWESRGAPPPLPPPPPAAAPAAASVSSPMQARVLLTGQTEKSRLDRARQNEAAYRRVCGGDLRAPTIHMPGSEDYKVNHEETGDFMRYVPAPWHGQFLRDFYSSPAGLRSIITKGRQIYQTTLFGIIMLDALVWKPGSISLVHNVKQDEAKTTLETRIAAPFRQSMPRLAANKKKCSIADYQIHIMRPEGEGGDSFIYAGLVTGRGQTPWITLATEFPTLCHKDPKAAMNFIREAVRGGQFASHNIEGTVVDVTGAPVLRELMEGCYDRQTRGIAPTWRDWVAYFYPWHMKPGNSIPDEQWDKKRKIGKDVLDYVAMLQDNKTLWQTGRDFHKGGLRLTEGQIRWYAVTLQNEAMGDWREMFGDYPSLPQEGKDLPDDAKYCRPLLAAAAKEGRIGDFGALQNKPVHMVCDIGWEDEFVCLFMQRAAEGFWHILRGFACQHYDFPQILERLRAEQWEQKTGASVLIHLPHDGHHQYSGTARKISTAYGRSIADEFRSAGYTVSDPERFPKPANKFLMFPIMREAFARMKFNRNGTDDLRDALREIHIEKIQTDGKVSRKLRASKHNHWHDALELGARLIVEGKIYDSATTGPAAAMAFLRAGARAAGGGLNHWSRRH